MRRLRKYSGNTSEYIQMMLRSRGMRLFLPTVLAYVLLTLACFYFQKKYFDRPDELIKNVTNWFQMVVPMFACWWVLVFHNEWVSGEGNELLYLYLTPRVILKAQLVAEAAYVVWAGVYFAGMQMVFDLQPFFLLRLCAESLFVGGTACLMTALVRNTGVPLLLVTVYCLSLDQIVQTLVLPELFGNLQTQEMSAANMRWAAETLGVAAVIHAATMLVYQYWKKYES